MERPAWSADVQQRHVCCSALFRDGEDDLARKFQSYHSTATKEEGPDTKRSTDGVHANRCRSKVTHSSNGTESTATDKWPKGIRVDAVDAAVTIVWCGVAVV